MDEWAFGTLGPLEVRREGVPLTLSAAKHRIVLATLVLQAGEVVSVDQLVTSLWNGARSTCQAYVMRLRQALGDPQAVVTRHGGYLLNADPALVDHVWFAGLVAQARRAGSP
jgi:DNA-binding SARP family transcriptional activator